MRWQWWFCSVRSSGDFVVWEAHASLKRWIEVILRTELKQSYCDIFEGAIMQPIVLDDPSHHIDQLCIRALTSERAFAAATWCARPRARRRRSLSPPLNILSLSSRHLLLLIASYSMALTRERKNPSRIAPEIEIFSIFAWLVPTLVWPRSITQGFESSARFCRTICWTW